VLKALIKGQRLEESGLKRSTCGRAVDDLIHLDLLDEKRTFLPEVRELFAAAGLLEIAG
jgi:hypothetical protein